MIKLKVFGVGSRIMGDDGIGIYIVEDLKRQKLPEGIECILGETDTDYCMDCIEDRDFVVIIDAAVTGKAPGAVTVFTASEIKVFSGNMFSMHTCSIITETLRQIETHRWILIGIEPEIIDFQLGLGDVLNTSFTQIILEVKKYILEIWATFSKQKVGF
jgi:hydrogenase maturation protease